MRSKKYLLYRKNRIALCPARHQQINWALLTALSGWWHPQGNPAQWALTRSTCWRWTTRQWDVDGNPMHWKHKISIPLTISPIHIVIKSVWDVYDFPSDWPVKQAAQEEDSELSSSSADSLTHNSVDTASESEKVTASDLKTSIPNDPLWDIISSGRGGCWGTRRYENPAGSIYGPCQMAPFGLAGYLVHLTGTILDLTQKPLGSFWHLPTGQSCTNWHPNTEGKSTAASAAWVLSEC